MQNDARSRTLTRAISFACLLALSSSCRTIPDDPPGQHGHFENEVRAEWLSHEGPDRKMKLLEDVYYIDPGGRRWHAPPGWVIDGASIPWPLWNKWIGLPFVGDYRGASVVHDVACDQREQACASSLTAHRMFYDASLCGGVSKRRARVMYWAVSNFGPKWGDQDPRAVLTPHQLDELTEIKAWIHTRGISETSSPEDVRIFLQELETGP